MGLAGVGPALLLLILLIVALLFGIKRLRNMGKDLGSAVRSFRQALHDPASDEALDSHFGDKHV